MSADINVTMEALVLLRVVESHHIHTVGLRVRLLLIFQFSEAAHIRLPLQMVIVARSKLL